MNAASVFQRLDHGLIASCQPVDGGPLDRTEIVVAMAQAAVAGGARGLRIEGAERVAAVAAACAAPIVGIIKRDLADSPVRITPFLDDVAQLAQAGATIIAFDATHRQRPVDPAELLAAIHAAGRLAMADCATFDEARAMAESGCDFVATTMSGYTGPDTPADPDLAFVERCAAAGYRTVAEGRYNSPERAAMALRAGAHAVTVGSAITRIEHIAGWFATALDEAAREAGR